MGSGWEGSTLRVAFHCGKLRKRVYFWVGHRLLAFDTHDGASL